MEHESTNEEGSKVQLKEKVDNTAKRKNMEEKICVN